MREILFEHLTLDNKGNLPNLIGLFDEKTWGHALHQPQGVSLLLTPLLLLNAKEKYDVLINNLLATNDPQVINDIAFTELREAMELGQHFKKCVSNKTIEDMLELMEDPDSLSAIYSYLLSEERFEMVPFCHNLHPSLKTYSLTSPLGGYQIFGEACLRLSQSKKTWQEKINILSHWSSHGVDVNMKPSTCVAHILNLNWGQYDMDVVEKLFEAGVDPRVMVTQKAKAKTTEKETPIQALEKILNNARNDTIKEQMLLWQAFFLKNDIHSSVASSAEMKNTLPKKM